MTVVPSSAAEIAAYEAARRPAVSVRAKAVATAGTVKAKAGALAAVRRLGRGLAGAPGEVLAYLVAASALAEVLAAGEGDPTTKARLKYEQTRREHRANAAVVTGMALAWSTAGWTAVASWVRTSDVAGWSAVIGIYLVMLGVAGLTSAVAGNGKTKEGWLWPVRLWLIVAASFVGLFVHLAVGVPTFVMTLALMALATVWLIWAAADGHVADNLEGGVTRVDEVAPDISRAAGVISAIAEPLRVTKDIEKRFIVVGPDLAWDAAHRWRDLTVQMTGKTVEQANAVKAQIAGNLRIPSEWLVLDDGANASQLVLHMAAEDPWPKVPTPAPILSTLSGDVWAPQRVGLDLLGSTPQEIVPVASSIALGGDSGTGKTALERLLALIILCDPRAQLDLFDFKGDGALSMFEPLAGEYSSSDEPEASEQFLVYLLERQKDLRARTALLADLAAKNRVDVRHAKITRELAHRTDIDLRPRFCLVDEVQDPIAHPRYGAEITRLLTYVARKGRSGGTKLILATQSWDVVTVPAPITKVLSTRISLRQPDYSASAQILGGKACKYRADLLPDVHGAAVIRAAGDGAALKGAIRVLLDYADTVETEDACRRLAAARGITTDQQATRPEPPRVLVEMARLLAEPSRQGRMLTVEVAAALKAYGIVEVTDADRAGAKTDEQILQEKVAALVRPFDVFARPDRDAGNRMAYWLTKEHRERGEVGVKAALDRLASGRPVGLRADHSGSPSRGSSGAPTGAPGRRRLHAV